MTRFHLAGHAVCVGLLIGCTEAPKPAAEVSSNSLGTPAASVTDDEPRLEIVPNVEQESSKSSGQAREVFAKLIKAAESGDADAWSQCEATLHELGLHALPALNAGLTDSNVISRELAAMFLAQLGPDASPAAEGLMQLLNDSSTFARVNAAAALSTFENPSEEVTRVLTQLLADDDVNVRLTAATSLRNVGESAHESIEGLIGLLADSDARIRLAAATTLGDIGPSALKSVKKLQLLEDDEDDQVKVAAARAIKKIDESARTEPVTIPASATE